MQFSYTKDILFSRIITVFQITPNLCLVPKNVQIFHQYWELLFYMSLYSQSIYSKQRKSFADRAKPGTFKIEYVSAYIKADLTVQVSQYLRTWGLGSSGPFADLCCKHTLCIPRSNPVLCNRRTLTYQVDILHWMPHKTWKYWQLRLTFLVVCLLIFFIII